MLVFVRRNNEQEPWLARIKNGEVIDSVSLSDMGIVSADGPFYSNIIKKYYTSVEVPLTAIQTSEMEHVAQAKYSDFTVTKEKMHGDSMFVQQDPETGDHAKHNKDIRQFEWYQSAGLSEIGW